jgi:hypothetical protein
MENILESGPKMFVNTVIEDPDDENYIILRTEKTQEKDAQKNDLKTRKGIICWGARKWQNLLHSMKHIMIRTQIVEILGEMLDGQFLENPKDKQQLHFPAQRLNMLPFVMW